MDVVKFLGTPPFYYKTYVDHIVFITKKKWIYMETESVFHIGRENVRLKNSFNSYCGVYLRVDQA